MPDETALPPGCEILLLDDDASLRLRLAARLRALGAAVTEAASLEEARRLARTLPFDFALLDLHLPDGRALELLREKIFSENTGVVVMTAFGGVSEAVEAMRLGAADYLTKPFEAEELPLAFLRCRKLTTAARRDELRGGKPGAATDLFFGTSLAGLRQALDTILASERNLAQRLPPVLIEGETGTGKTALARWLHAHGARASRPFVPVNCAALPETLVESELFGHERGAFTDARQARLGLFEAADGGTLFLDEVGTLAPGTQAKLLSAIEEGKIRRLGHTREIAVDVRLITASNRPLEDLVAAGSFREDLYYRLKLLALVLPPLRERGTDIVALAHHLLASLAARYRLPRLTLSPAAEARLLAHPWRGNIRELAHELERAAIFRAGEVLDLAHLGPAAAAAPAHWRNPAWRLPDDGFQLDRMIDEMIADALRESGGNVSATARRLGVTRDFLRYRMGHGKDAAS